MKKLTLLVITLMLLVITVPALAQAYTQRVSPAYVLLSEEGDKIAEIWNIQGDWFVFGSVTHYCQCEVNCEYTYPDPTKKADPLPSPTPGAQDPTPTPPDELTPIPTYTPVPQPTPTVEQVFCHCEQGEGEGAEGRKNCHPAKYNNGHAKHEWDYWSTDGTCEGWNH